jgi:hypothetical protein
MRRSRRRTRRRNKGFSKPIVRLHSYGMIVFHPDAGCTHIRRLNRVHFVNQGAILEVVAHFAKLTTLWRNIPWENLLKTHSMPIISCKNSCGSDVKISRKMECKIGNFLSGKGPFLGPPPTNSRLAHTTLYVVSKLYATHNNYYFSNFGTRIILRWGFWFLLLIFPADLSVHGAHYLVGNYFRRTRCFPHSHNSQSHTHSKFVLYRLSSAS